MTSSAAQHRRHFLSWDRPLLPQAVAFLAGDWAGGMPLDLRRTLVVVPTRQSSRRLREALAEHAATFEQAVFPPVMMLSGALLSRAPAPDAAPKLCSLLAWCEVVAAIALEDFREVFPVDPPSRNFSWRLRLAREFARLQDELGKSGLRFADVAERAGADFPEDGRWRQLGELESLFDAALARRGLRAAQAAEIATAKNPPLPPDVEKIVVLAAPDPLPLALQVLRAQSHALPVEIVIFAPPAESANFDEWGRPGEAAWARRELPLPDFERRVQLKRDPAEQAEQIVSLARVYGDVGGVLGVGVADPEVLPSLEHHLARAGLAAFNPEGRPRQGDRLHQLLAALAALVADDAFITVEALARCPDFLEFLGGRVGNGFSAARFLDQLDELHARHLPSDLAAARRAAPASVELALIAEVRANLIRGAFPANASAALAEIFAARRFDLAQPDDARAVEAAEAWAEVAHEAAAAAEMFDRVTIVEWWEIALQRYAETRQFDDKPASAVELQGWLELLWEDAPHLIVAGFNDGCVPDAIVGDPFLPESLRSRLGLQTNGARLARDAYLLHALAASRAEGGRLEVLLGKTSSAGDPLRPSRLLLRCPDAELPRRVEFLFRPAAAPRANPAWRRAWKLRPANIGALRAALTLKPPTRVAVTALRAWLECPFRFYLRHGLRMEAVDAGKTELDALDFGSLCHGALERMGREPALRDCTEAKALREFLLATFDAEAARRFGVELTLPLLVQLESARQRLGRAADVQAQARAEGWVIHAVERSFVLEVGGLAVSGKIDRIDRHEVTGAIRVLDYKTSDRSTLPAEMHLRGLRRDGWPPDFARVTTGGRELAWRDLQLPLYLRALAGEFPGWPQAGYFGLPKAASETAIAEWQDYTPELAESAWRCATGVAAAIQAGEFWPPNENIPAERDEFASLFHHGVADSVEWPGGAT